MNGVLLTSAIAQSMAGLPGQTHDRHQSLDPDHQWSSSTVWHGRYFETGSKWHPSVQPSAAVDSVIVMTPTCKIKTEAYMAEKYY